MYYKDTMGLKPNIEEKLRRAIIDADISRYRLAKLSGVTEGALSHFVNRNRTITLTTAAKLAAVLDLELTPKGQSPIKRTKKKGR